MNTRKVWNYVVRQVWSADWNVYNDVSPMELAIIVNKPTPIFRSLFKSFTRGNANAPSFLELISVHYQAVDSVLLLQATCPSP